MQPRRYWRALVFLIFFSGCSHYSYWQGQALLQEEDYAGSKRQFSDALRSDPQDYRSQRGLGIACFKSGESLQALALLQEVRKVKPDDGLALLYLGMTFEKIGKYDSALTQYARYTRLSRVSSVRKQIQARAAFISKMRMEQQVQESIRQEHNVRADSLPDNTVAVLYFKNIAQKEEMDPLFKGLAELLSIDLGKVKSLNLLERINLQRLLDERAVEKSAMFDKSTAPRCGRLLGAGTLIMGGYITLENDWLQIGAAPVKTATGELLGNGIQVSDHIEQLFKMEKEIVFHLIKQMGIELTTAEIEEIRKFPTTSVKAFLKYCQGLDYEDKGLFDKAKQTYGKAFSIDRQFLKARDRKNEIDLGHVIGTTTVPKFEIAVISPLMPSPAPVTDFSFGAIRNETRLKNFLQELQQITTRGPEEIPLGTVTISGKLPK